MSNMIFNPAPGWPKPPAGWVPPEGWQPDPSWPAAPVNWQLWVPATPSYGLLPSLPSHAPATPPSTPFAPMVLPSQGQNQQFNSPYNPPSPFNGNVQPPFGNGSTQNSSPNFGSPSFSNNSVPPTKKSKKGLWIGLSVGLGVILLPIIAVIVIFSMMMNSVQQVAQESLDDFNSPPIAAVEVYYPQDRPGYQDMSDTVIGMYEGYQARLSAGDIYDIVPRSEAGINYYGDFMLLLGDIRGALRFWVYESTDATEVDDQIVSFKNQALELERKLLAGEDFGVDITFTRSDGTVYTSDGSNKSISIAEAEVMAQNYVGSLGSDGTYADASIELAGFFNLGVDWKWSNIKEYCPGGSAVEENDIAAAYCTTSPDRIYVNTESSSAGDTVRHVSWVDIMRHEIAHHLIHKICNTSNPAIAGAYSEAVTSSYAVLFLGASQENLQHTNDSKYPQYVMTEETNMVATAIHDNQTCT